MPDPEAWELEPTADKLRVFVSSRLQECKEERSAAREAILAINHDPVLFEHVGARPFKARNLYLSRLRSSTIMIGIFRLGYGYVDKNGGMAISGLEDEFIFAEQNGIPTLLYVYEESDGREEDLTRLIERASAKLSIWYYRDPSELKERIRDDVTATITRMVLRPELSRGALRESSKDLIQRAQRRQGLLLARAALVGTLVEFSTNHGVVCVCGAAGTGKTTLAALYAEAEQAFFIRASSLTPRDVFAVCAQTLRADQPAPFTFASLAGARLSFSTAWADATNAVLVLDECECIDEVLTAINAGGGISPKKRLIFTSRTCSAEFASLEIPALTEEEVAAVFSAAQVPQEQRPTGPLTPLKVQELIAAIERDVIPLGATAKEIVSYLALSPVQLMADDILSLIGDTALNIEALYDRIAGAGRLIHDSPGGFRLMHAETASQYADEIARSPQRHRFYASRLAHLFENRGDFRSAYKVSVKLADGSERPLFMPALRQSVQLGDFRLGLVIAENALEQARGVERRQETFEMMLQLVYPLELMGDAARANALLDEAEALVQDLGDDARTLINEQRLSSRARRTLSRSDVEGLIDVYAQYGVEERDWDQARVGIELSALYIAGKQFESAVEILRPAIVVFSEYGDEYGLDTAERNLAGALAGLSGNDEEVDALAQRIAERASDGADTRRQRAWYANILTRRYRAAGRFDEAEAVAKEILSISDELGDEALSAITYINLGNVYKDKADAKGALEAYDKAALAAQRCGRRDVEADSSRLRAGVLNDLSDSAPTALERHNQAKLFAQHAIGLLQGTIYHEALARAFVELADAETGLRNVRAAAQAWFDAAKQFRLTSDIEPYERALLNAAEAAIESDIALYVSRMADLFDLKLDPKNQVLAQSFVRLVAPIIELAPRNALVPLLGQHLYKIRGELPALLRPLLLTALTDAIESFFERHDGESWRPLYAALIAPFLAQDNERDFAQQRLASALTKGVRGLDMRRMDSGDLLWTVALNLAQPTVLNIVTLDDSPATFVAAQTLALFLKAFEDEIKDIVGRSDLVELMVQVASIDQMPEDVRRLTVERLDVDRLLEAQSAAVTRSDGYRGEVPMMVFLHPDFLSRAVAGEGVSGALQMLLGLTLIELAHLTFKGEVDEDQIRPKIVSLIKRTLS